MTLLGRLSFGAFGIVFLVLVVVSAVFTGTALIVVDPSIGAISRDVGNLSGPAVPALWRDAEQGAGNECPGVSWSVLGALGWMTSKSGRLPEAPPPWALTVRGPFGVVPVLDGHRGVMLDSEALRSVQILCSEVAATGSLQGALGVLTGDQRMVGVINTLATSLSVAPDLSAGRAVVLEFAARAMGTPYQWGGNGPSTYDCSGLVVAAFKAAGLSLPRTAQAQFDRYAASEPPNIPGDLIFFGSSAADISHVGIEIGDDLMIDAPHTGAFVRIENQNWPDVIGYGSPSS